MVTKSRRRTTCTCLLPQAQTIGGTRFNFFIVELARFLVDSWFFWKSRRRCTKEMHQVSKRADLLFAVFQVSSEKEFHEFNLFCYRLIVHSWRRSTVTDGAVWRLPRTTRFLDAKECNNWVQIRIDDHRIQSNNKYNSELQKSRRKEVCTWWHDMNDNVTIKGIAFA